ncbi:MAG TPA: EamA family transporter [Ferruginibacter sp.]|nr:EamA family transporter [Ferruginibacter sp.]
MRLNKLVPVASIIFSCVLWGLSISITKKTTGVLYFPHIAFYRFIISSIALIPCAINKEFLWPHKKDLPKFIIVAFLTVPCTFLLQFAGLSLTSGTSASLMIGMTPVMFAIISFFFLKEKLSTLTLIGILISIIGIYIVIGGSVSNNNWIGDGLIILSLITLSLSVVFSQQLMTKYSPLVLTSYVIWFGTILLIPASLFLYGSPPTNLSSSTWISLLIQGIVCTSIASLLWNYGLQKVSIAKTGIYANIEPIAGIFFSALLLHEIINFQVIAGGFLVILAAIIIDYPQWRNDS